MRDFAPMPNTSGSLFSTKANMEDPNMQHLIDAETKRELYRINYDLAVLRRRSWFLFFIPLIWIKVMFGPINVKINEHPAPVIPNNVVLDQLGHECLSASLGCEEPQVGQPFCFFVTVKQEVQLALELMLPDHLLESFFCCLFCCHACSYFLLG